MEPQVNYDQRYSGLLTVYRLRSFAAAAVELSLTASAVSKQIRSLESDLGRPLFIRSGSRLIPTRACEAIVPFAEKIDALCVRMQQELAARQAQAEAHQAAELPEQTGVPMDTVSLDKLLEDIRDM